MKMQKMIVPFEVKDFGETDDGGNYEFSGYASTFGNVDRGQDVVIRGAFDETIKDFQGADKLPVLWQHSHDMPLGVFVEIRADSKGLFVRGIMPKADEFVSGRVMPQMGVGSIKKMSIGYCTEDFAWDGNVRQLKKVKLYEISLVTIPMNNEADVTGFKSMAANDLPLAPHDAAWDAQAATARVKAWSGATDEPNAKYAEAFFGFDAAYADDFAAYKLPYADIIDGKLMAVPRGVFAAAAALAGARGGVDIPQDGRGDVVASVDKYYEKMGLDSPFSEKSCFRIDSLDALTERELEKLFKRGVQLPGECARALVSAHKSLMRDAEKIKRDAENEPSIDLLLKSIKELGKK